MRGFICSMAAILSISFTIFNSDINADSGDQNKPADSIAISPEMAYAINDFSIRCFQEAIKSDDSDNTFISPLSLSIALGMAWNGAQGITEEDMRTVLGYGTLGKDTINEAYKNLINILPKIDPDVILEIANSIWIRQGYKISKQFLDVNSKYFRSRVEAIDLNSEKSIGAINKWVSQSTHDKIKTIISPPVNPNVMMYLINAVYFKGEWTYKFDPANTKKAPFHITPEKDTTCDMMSQKGNFPIQINRFFQAIDLPYGDGDYSMAIFLPVEGQSVEDLLSKLNPARLSTAMRTFKSRQVTVYLPKFKLTYSKLMNRILQTMDMSVAFDMGKADFRGMEPKGELYISRVLHKTFIQVDEKGTEAAAVTGVEMMTKAMPPQPLEIRIDRPFVIVIHEKSSGTILFMGKISNPVWEK